MRYLMSVVAHEPTRLPSGSGSIEPCNALFNKRCGGQTVVIAIDKYCSSWVVVVNMGPTLLKKDAEVEQNRISLPQFHCQGLSTEAGIHSRC